MALDLDKLVFTVETKELDDAITKLEKLGTAVSALSKPLQKLEKDTNTVSDGVKGLGEEQETTYKKLSSVEKALEKQATRMKVLRDQTIELTDGVEKLGQGFTSSQASQLANLKLMGSTVDQIKALSKSFKEYNAITGVNTFDASANGLSRLNKEIKELSQVNELAAKGFGLTKEELKFLARDSNSLTQVFAAEGKSAEELKLALEKLNTEFVQASKLKNSLTAAAKINEDAVKSEAKAIAEAKKLQEDSSEAMFRNNLARQEQERKTHSQVMKEMKDFYSEQEKVAKQANQAIKPSQDSHVTEFYKNQAKASHDAAKATDFLTREMNRAENALNGMNESMNISTSNRLLRFKEAMKASGVETAQATALLQKYEATLKATDAASTTKKGRTRKDELDYLARATSVQLGDIGVSLAGGQNPLIVMIQQG